MRRLLSGRAKPSPEKKPQEPATETAFSRADALRDAGDWASAALEYAYGLERAPDDAPMWVQYGHALSQIGALDRAQAAYGKARELDPTDADVNIHLGHVLKARGLFGMALAAYEMAIGLGSRDLHALHFIATQTGRQADWRAVADAYKVATTENRRDRPAWIQLGHALKEAGDLADAADAYDRARELAEDTEIMVQIGHLERLRGADAPAAEAYLQAVRLGSRDRNALEYLTLSDQAHRLIQLLLSSLLPSGFAGAEEDQPAPIGAFGAVILRRLALQPFQPQ